MRRADQGHPHGDETPRDHDACNPASRTPALHDESAGNFQNDVAEGEDARPEPNYAIVEAQIVRHLQGSGGQIVAIKVSNYVKQEHIGQKTQGNPTTSAAGNDICGNRWGRQFFSAEIGLVGRVRPEKSRDYIPDVARR